MSLFLYLIQLFCKKSLFLYYKRYEKVIRHEYQNESLKYLDLIAS